MNAESIIDAVSRESGVSVTSMTPKDIVARVASARGIPIDRLKGSGRHRSIVRARWEAMYLLRANTRMSYPEIGRLMKRDHASVMYGVAAVDADVHRCPSYGIELATLLMVMTFVRALEVAA